jgi:hypothetical protein
MASSAKKNRTNHLATEMQHWLWSKLGDKRTPKVDEIEQFISDHLSKMGLELLPEESVKESAKIPALLQKKPEQAQSKRMRELAGIPHKRNFV